MFGYTIAFVGLCAVLIWATVLKPRSRMPRAVNVVYWLVSGFFGIFLVAGVARLAVLGTAPQSIGWLYYAPEAARLTVLLGLVALAILTGHRLATGAPENDEEAEPSE